MFLRSVMRMGGRRYEEAASKIVNVFQVNTNVLVSHFTGVRILQLLRWKVNQPREVSDITIRDVSERLGALGYVTSNIESVLKHFGKHGLVNSLSKPEPPWDNADVVRLGAAGRYYLEELLFEREYVQGLTDDTIVYEENVLAALELLHKDTQRTWADRYTEKTRTLLVYLGRKEREELQRLGAPDKRPTWLTPIAEEIGIKFFGASFAQDLRAAPARRR
jgi:hypothetical protein